MEKFSSFLVPSEYKNFEEYKFNKLLCKMREDVEDIILSKNENECFDFVVFKSKNNIKDMKIVNEMSKIIIEELHKLGWKTALAYGNTALYIYHDKEPSCLAWMKETI